MKDAGSGDTAPEHLTAENPIYYRERGTPAGMCVKEYPTGRRELVTFDLATGAEVVVRRLINFGVLKGKITMADNFDAPLPDDLLDAFEGH